MHNDKSAKLRRRQVAFKNLKVQLQNWKNAKSEQAITAILSNKDLNRVKREVTTLDNIRKDKILKCEGLIKVLENKVL